MSVRASIDSLAWESEFFALPTAKLNFANPEAQPIGIDELAHFKLVQAKIPASQIELIDELSALDFHLVEGEVDFILPVNEANDLKPELNYSTRLATEHDIARLRAVASDVFQHSRFRTPWYQPDDSSRFYALWVEKAVLGTFDRQCLLLEDERGNTLGFVTLRSTDELQGRIGLLAVWPEYNNKGIGIELMKVAKRWCAEQGLKSLLVATQMGNVAALRLYIRSGASIHSTAYWLYK
ncbi:dTDP-4-amino-4,6-dideoxy-D-galactose acyltransferase [Budvicia diplopodorum]|uniref:dTDP-4-amino-4,6-dideoxy-D-galactose acyltransferase n=1 Tax=Budvicia diplopodorum TaxID=1119056 RepID=UPI00135B61B6|nr:dTDP-4-amino-4,6-dideoxy-D-galactose acyltransferase [Budvicia diplopodorum]